MSYILRSQFVTSSLVSQNVIPGKEVTMKELVQQQLIERRIFIIHGHKVMLSMHLAELYGVTTGALIQAVKRNIERFPKDFMFPPYKTRGYELEITNCDFKLGWSTSCQSLCLYRTRCCNAFQCLKK